MDAILRMGLAVNSVSFPREWIWNYSTKGLQTLPLTIIDRVDQLGPLCVCRKYPPNRSLLPVPRRVPRHTHPLTFIIKRKCGLAPTTVCEWMTAHSTQEQRGCPSVATQPCLPLLSHECRTLRKRCLLVFTYVNWGQRRQPIWWWLTARKKRKDLIGVLKKKSQLGPPEFPVLRLCYISAASLNKVTLRSAKH